MRISDWSSDVCSSDLPINDERVLFFHVWWSAEKALGLEPLRSQQLSFVGLDEETLVHFGMTRATSVSPDRPRRENIFLQDRDAMRREIGSASGRERVCQYV